jgi:nitrogenase subunit NifH
MELEAKVKLLEKELNFSDKKVIFFDMTIDVAEEAFKIPIRKKHLPEQLSDTKSNNKKA